MSTEKSVPPDQMTLFGPTEPAPPPPAEPPPSKAPRPKRQPAAPKPPTAPPIPNVATTKAQNPEPPLRRGSGLVPEGDVRLTANLREDLHLRLKIAAAQRRTTIGEIIEELVEKYI